MKNKYKEIFKNRLVENKNLCLTIIYARIKDLLELGQKAEAEKLYFLAKDYEKLIPVEYFVLPGTTKCINEKCKNDITVPVHETNGLCIPCFTSNA